MKLRKIGTLFLLVAMTAILAVACNSEVADGSVANADPGKELVYATFGNSSKAIAVDSVVGYKTYGELYWFYTAEKMDDYGRTGQQLSPVPVKGQGETEHTPGLDGKEVGPFSQGAWSFTLYAYGDAEKTTLYYEGTNTSVELRANQQNNIPVTVEPQGTTGKISFKDAWYEWDSFGTAAVNLTITLTSSDNTVYNCTTKTLEKSGDKYPITGYITYGELVDRFPAGIYTAQFKVVSIPANANSEPYEFVSQPLAFRVYGNLETQLTGNLVEGLFATGYFTVPEQQINVFNATVVGETVQEVKQEVAIAPEKYSDSQVQQTTNITFPSGSITSEQHSLMVAVTNMADASSKFEVTGGDTAVAGIDLQLMKITTTDTTTTEVPVTDFVKDRGESTEEIHYVTIETYIAKGFNTVTVVYNGTTYSDQPVANNGATSSNEADVYATDALMGATNLGYSQESGKLRFKTTHFSEFYVKSDVQALNVTTNTVYISLTAAVEGASAGDEIRLLKNIELSDQLWIGKELTLDLNGKTVSLNKGTNASIHTNGVIGVLRGGEVTIKDSGTNGAIDGTVGTKAYCGIGVTKLGESGDANAKLTVESGIIKGYYYGISGNGTRHNTEITINGGTIEGGCTASGEGTGIYHPQDGTLIITGGAVSGIDAAVELRSGSANVTGGTFTATKAPTAYEANGNGTTTSGVAFAVAQHTTQKAIDVKISGGTFTGNTAFSYMNPQNNSTTNTSVVISGGSFTSTATSSSVAVESAYTEFIKGGTLNVEPELKYIKKGYQAIAATPSTGWWTVKEVTPADGKVKLIEPDGSIYFYHDLQTALDAASTVAFNKDAEEDNRPVIELLADLTDSDSSRVFATNYKYSINKSIVLDGNGRKITSSQGRVLGINKEINNHFEQGSLIDVVIKNVDVICTKYDNQGPIFTRGNISSVVMDNVGIYIDSNSNSYSQMFTVGNSNQPIATLEFNNCRFGSSDHPAYYAICSYNPVSLSITNSEIYGWSCLYFKPGSDGSTVNVNGGDFKSEGKSGQTNSFGMIVMESSSNTVNLSDMIAASVYTAATDSSQSLVTISEWDATNDNNHINVSGCTIRIEGTNALLIRDKGYVDNTLTITDSEVTIIKGDSKQIITEYSYQTDLTGKDVGYFYYGNNGSATYVCCDGYFTFTNLISNSGSWFCNGEWLAFIANVEISESLTLNMKQSKKGTFKFILGEKTLTKTDSGSITIAEGVILETDKEFDSDFFTAPAGKQIEKTSITDGWRYKAVSL